MIILNYKLFGFIGGISKNDFFKYYNIDKYYIAYLYIPEQAKIDFTLLKYLFNFCENSFSIASSFKKSIIDNVYSLFEEIFLKNQIENKMIIEADSPNMDNNIFNQWKFLLDLIIIIIKDDSSPFLCFMNEYENIISSKTKID